MRERSAVSSCPTSPSSCIRPLGGRHRLLERCRPIFQVQQGGGQELAAREAAADGACIKQRQADLAFAKLRQGHAKGVEGGEGKQTRGDRRYQRQDELAQRSNPEGEILEPE